MEIKFYRHKEYKNVFLKRSVYCGGNKDTKFYEVTNNWVMAYRSLLDEEEKHNDFMRWAVLFPEQTVETNIEKNFEFDGFKGTLKKVVSLEVSDFELITMVEKEG